MATGRPTPPPARSTARRPPAPLRSPSANRASPNGASGKVAARKVAAQKGANPVARPPVRSARPAPERAARPTVSPTSAQRFSARVRSRRRRRILIALAVVLVVAGAGWLAVKSPWATVERVQVTGTDRIPVADIRAAAATELGHPLLLARTADVRRRIAAMRLVRQVSVTRQFPSGLRIVVTERQPVAAVPDGRAVALVDDDGVVVERDAQAPSGLPLILVAAGPADATSVRGCLAVLHGLPAILAGQLRSIGASSADGIHLTLKNGATVQWGNGDQTPLKAEVLLALLPQHASQYDVRSPDTPAVVKK